MIALKTVPEPAPCSPGLAHFLPGLGRQAWSMRLRFSLSVPISWDGEDEPKAKLVPGKPSLHH